MALQLVEVEGGGACKIFWRTHGRVALKLLEGSQGGV